MNIAQKPSQIILREDLSLESFTEEQIFQLIESEKGLLIGGLCLNIKHLQTFLTPTVTLLTVLNGTTSGWTLQKDKSDSSDIFRFFTTRNMKEFPFTGTELPNVGTFFFSEVLPSCCSQHTETSVLRNISNYVLSHS